ncbi:dynactin subunit 2-like [Dendronephthya gigantea]|uniref:dynactin subunit 2-like n=1 Tax=Dendronephthya gigantea TaxID=151771 RepID=UPI00106CE01D|nr:dynactin subunit 2-like [Dendronephthya gigantea]
MEGKSKYAGLPGIDTDSPDVFETVEEGGVKIESQKSKDEFESEDIEHVSVNKKEAFNKFKGKYLDADSTDFSGNVGKLKMRGYETRGEYEIIGDRSITKETPGQKYQRLQVEIEELAEELEKIKDDAKNVEKQNKFSPTGLATEVKHLQQQLQSWQIDALIGSEFSAGSTHPEGTVQKKLQNQLESYKEKAKSKPSSKEQVDEDCVTYKLLYKPEQAKLAQLSHVSELEERVKNLENLLGIDSPHLSTLFDQSVTDERTLSAAISDVQDKLAVLDTTHVEHIDARLQGLLHHLDELSSKKSEKENVENQKKISELYELVTKWDATADVVPDLIYRLETLKSLHNQANQFGSSLTHLDSTQTAITSQLQTQQKLLAKIAQNFETNVASIGENCTKLDERISNLMKTYKKTGR